MRANSCFSIYIYSTILPEKGIILFLAGASQIRNKFRPKQSRRRTARIKPEGESEERGRNKGERRRSCLRATRKTRRVLDFAITAVYEVSLQALKAAAAAAIVRAGFEIVVGKALKIVRAMKFSAIEQRKTREKTV